ncbi:hypothetical protein [Veillonella sp. R32]|uniref:hypothetical protein n=1 Tax=Veillonella sp. R32 TaxID=2021312 RepID=UPI001389903C|nr:hypothetical protein [Veillonella sp. R32]
MESKEKTASRTAIHETASEEYCNKQTSLLLYQFPAAISNERGIIWLRMGNISMAEHFYITF